LRRLDDGKLTKAAMTVEELLATSRL
jgi:hypothetical protein